MIHKDFLQTFATTDPPTVKAVRDIFIPRLRSEITELRSLERDCTDRGCGSCFAADIQAAENALRQAIERISGSKDGTP